MKVIKEEVYTVNNCKLLIKKGYYRVVSIEKHKNDLITLHLKKCSFNLRHTPERIRTRKIKLSTYERISLMYY